MKRLLLAVALMAPGASPAGAQAVSGPLVVFNAGSLAQPFRQLLAEFRKAHPGVVPMQESSGSLEAARKITELGKIPDVIAVADYRVIAAVLMPRYADGYQVFASNAMVLAFTDRSAGAGEVTGENWWRILLRPGVRWGQSDPRLDPNGYRALMVYQLAEAHYRQPGLAARLRAALQPKYMRPAEAQLVGLLQAGELDYAWSYESLARSAGLRWVDLPAEIDLSDPAMAAGYGHAEVALPPPRPGGADSLRFRGEPIVYALTVPKGAPHRATGEAFVRYVLSDAGKRIMREAGFRVK